MSSYLSQMSKIKNKKCQLEIFFFFSFSASNKKCWFF